MSNAALARRGVLAGITAGAGALAAPALTRPAALEQTVWSDGGTVPRLGGQINWRSAGSANAPSIVLLHKVGGWLADWRKIAPLLAARYRVIAMDMPGCGDSRMDGEPPFVVTVDENAAAILAALSELGVERFALCGNSLGGVCAIAMAAMHPERVEKLVIISAGLASGISRAALDAQESKRDPALWTADWTPIPRSAEQVASFGSLDASVEVERNQSRAKAGRWVRPGERGVSLTDAALLLSRVKAPTLLIYPDRGTYERYIDVARKALPSARIVKMMNTGSFIHQEKPAETAALMLNFLDSRP